ncbi:MULTISPECIES: SDR family oxidoreductase [unclassified Lactobacillus]|uniref:SDR family oxidoreductase n=1 Tax=unclassified Lactobacillus TaxID=2620435 RepID=UPI000EFB8F52|nr:MULTISPECIES: SDR family oxidoreductase [unclassified Lactobacillus]RMC23863.1 NAD-dependent epimerase/dehydratase family protein [Lactobacillus sp. ESL0247]RMC27607.1 NAD-dependent epimerase/dehydratase family protein [Lactobacillus sp. ESL0246]RMC30887.1 NAD-dependent epimerase/dehydratase family protein [Lactobacillus sp. ESL0245]
MINLLILGASGQIAQLAEELLHKHQEVKVTYYLRHIDKFPSARKDWGTIIQGDVTDTTKLTQAMTDQDIIYANLAGNNIEQQAKSTVKAMKKQHIKRLIWISTLGIYNEVPGKFGEWNNQMLGESYLPTYAAAAKVIENSGLNYTIIRPAWLQDKDEIDYELTQKNESFKGTEVSRKSIASLITDLVLNPSKHVNESLGVNKPNTDGDKPSWY